MIALANESWHAAHVHQIAEQIRAQHQVYEDGVGQTAYVLSIEQAADLLTQALSDAVAAKEYLGWHAFCEQHQQKTDDLCPRCQLEAAEAQLTDARRALKLYGVHRLGCPYATTYQADDCNCGLAAALRARAQELQG